MDLVFGAGPQPASFASSHKNKLRNPAAVTLAKKRQLASGYNFFTSIGINYRFGSKLHNVVNPRFDRSNSSGEDYEVLNT